MIQDPEEYGGWGNLGFSDLASIVSDNPDELLDYIKSNVITVEGLSKFLRNKKEAMRMIAFNMLLSKKQVKSIKITNSSTLYECFKDIANNPTEEIWMLIMNNSNQVVKKVCISQGGMSACAADTKVIMHKALITGKCCAIALAHNHPSGSLEPSLQDNNVTKNIKEACQIMSIRFLDHLIISSEGYYSYNDNNQI